MVLSDLNINDYLNDFLANIKNELPKNSFKFSDFEIAYNKSIIALEEKYLQDNITDTEDLSWLEVFKRTIFHIYRVINSPRFTISSHKEFLNIEKIVRIDSVDVMESSKKDAYWNRDGSGKIYPVQFSTSINERDICIYENKFVVFVVDLMIGFVNQSIYHLRKKLKYLSKNFSNKNFSFREASSVLELAGLRQVDKNTLVDDVPFLTKSESNIIKNLEKLDFLRKELYRITFTSFYKEVSKAGHITHDRVYATNLLLGDHDYSEIYNFYLKYLLVRRSSDFEDDPVDEIYYYAYVGSNLLRSLIELGFDIIENQEIYDDGHHLTLKMFNCEKDGIKVHADMHENFIDVTFKATYIESENNQRGENNICLIMMPNFEFKDEDKRKEYCTKLVKEKLKEGKYTNAFVISPEDEYGIPELVTVTPFAGIIDVGLKNVIQSSLVFSEGDSKMYSKFCPICGTRVDGEWEDGNCHCLICDSIWTTFEDKVHPENKNTIWLKAIKRNVEQ